MKTPKIVLAALASLTLASAHPALAQGPVGEVAFENSGASAAQGPFLRGLALLHNFEYADAAVEFRKAQAADPDFALAYWGEAMTYNHPVWMEQDLQKAREALARLGADPQARAAKARTPREKAYLHAVETLYGEGAKEERDFRYADEMAALHQRFPDDVDATAFYALSLLGTAHEGRDVATYMRAAALLEEVFPDHRTHPGVLHYLIRSYDDPDHAPLGLRAATLYSKVAPDAGHAQHMTSHIFIALGRWDDVIAANQTAIGVVKAQATAKGENPARADCGHYGEWLVYARLQQGDAAAARAASDACRVVAAERLANLKPTPVLEPGRSSVLSHTDMAVREAIETGAWADDAVLPVAPGTYLTSRFLQAYGEAIVSAEAGDKPRFTKASARVREALVRLQDESRTQGREGVFDSVQIMADQIAALDMIAGGDRAAGLAALRKTAAAETAMPFEFGPPAVLKPSQELLGDELLKAGDAQGAAAAYQATLKRAPGRALALAGLKTAQAARP